MSNRARHLLLVHADGTLKLQLMPQGGSDMQHIRDAVGGFVEPVRINAGGQFGYMDEDRRQKRLLYNPVGSMIHLLATGRGSTAVLGPLAIVLEAGIVPEPAPVLESKG